MKFNIKTLKQINTADDLLALAYDLAMKYGSNNCTKELDVLEQYYYKK